MKCSTIGFNVMLLALVLIASAAAQESRKDKKSPLPGNATWELRAFDSLFRVVRTEYDAEAKRVTWSVETREGYRTLDFVEALSRRPFTFRFLDGDNNELATIQLNKDDYQGIPKERVMKARTPLTITLDLPRAMPKAKKVVLARGAP